MESQFVRVTKYIIKREIRLHSAVKNLPSVSPFNEIIANSNLQNDVWCRFGKRSAEMRKISEVHGKYFKRSNFICSLRYKEIEVLAEGKNIDKLLDYAAFVLIKKIIEAYPELNIKIPEKPLMQENILFYKILRCVNDKQRDLMLCVREPKTDDDVTNEAGNWISEFKVEDRHFRGIGKTRFQSIMKAAEEVYAAIHGYRHGDMHVNLLGTFDAEAFEWVFGKELS